MVANLLSALKPGSRELIDFGAASAHTHAAGLDRIKDLCERMRRGEVDVLLVNGPNPLFTLPPSWEAEKALAAVPFIVSFASVADETSERAHLVLPTHTPLESWGDYSPRAGVIGPAAARDGTGLRHPAARATSSSARASASRGTRRSPGRTTTATCASPGER